MGSTVSKTKDSRPQMLPPGQEGVWSRRQHTQHGDRNRTGLQTKQCRLRSEDSSYSAVRGHGHPHQVQVWSIEPKRVKRTRIIAHERSCKKIEESGGPLSSDWISSISSGTIGGAPLDSNHSLYLLSDSSFCLRAFLPPLRGFQFGSNLSLGGCWTWYPDDPWPPRFPMWPATKAGDTRAAAKRQIGLRAKQRATSRQTAMEGEAKRQWQTARESDYGWQPNFVGFNQQLTSSSVSSFCSGRSWAKHIGLAR